MKRVSQREETGSGWRERPEGKEEQSAERLGLAKKNVFRRFNIKSGFYTGTPWLTEAGTNWRFKY